MRDGTVIWRHDTPHGKMAASPAVWRDQLIVHGMDGHVWVLAAPTASCSGTTRSARRSSRRRSSSTASTSSAPGTATITALDLRTHRVRWRRAGRLQDHLVGGARRRARSTSATTAAGCSRSPRAPGALRWSRSVNGRVYGTPAVAGGRVFVPSSTGGSLTAFSTSGRFLWRRTTGSYVYSSPAVAAGPRLLRLLQRRLLRALGRERRDALGASARAARSRARRSSSTASPTPARSRTGSSASTCAAAASCSTSRTASTCPSRAAAQRLLLHGYSRLYAVEAR